MVEMDTDVFIEKLRTCNRGLTSKALATSGAEKSLRSASLKGCCFKRPIVRSNVYGSWALYRLLYSRDFINYWIKIDIRMHTFQMFLLVRRVCCRPKSCIFLWFPWVAHAYLTSMSSICFSYNKVQCLSIQCTFIALVRRAGWPDISAFENRFEQHVLSISYRFYSLK